MNNQPYIVTIVDDNDAIRRSFRYLLEHSGYTVFDHPSADAFLDSHTDLQPDCVLLDLEMPGQNGTAVLAHLFQSQSGIPVVVITGTDRTRLLETAEQFDVGAVLRKPVNSSQLIKTVSKLLPKNRSTARQMTT